MIDVLRRTLLRGLFGFLAVSTAAVGQATAETSDFNAFLAKLWPDAQASGVTRETFDTAFKGVTPDASIIAQTKKQSEFVRPIWAYVDSAIGGTRVARGREAANQWESTVTAIEARYGVDRRAFIGVWGMETSYGSFFGNSYVIRSLATLAFVRYRDDFFRNELIIALKILQEGHVDRADMKGSWAGAMGHTQFMPSSFQKYAVDHDRDGHKDIWSTVPDALASTANYLKEHGWQNGLPWGFEVSVPGGLDLKQALGRKTFAAFAAVGIKRADGEAMPRRGEATLYFPSGIRGPALLITDNFKVIKAYNSSDAYAMGVGLLGDMIYGGDSFIKAWPKKDPQLSKEQRFEVQKLLTRRGLYKGKIDGRFGEQSRESITQFQAQNNLTPDGYPNAELLAKLKTAPSGISR